MSIFGKTKPKPSSSPQIKNQNSLDNSAKSLEKCGPMSSQKKHSFADTSFVRKHFLNLRLLPIFFFVLSSCVSVNLKQGALVKSEKFKFAEPTSPFVKIKNKNFDSFWMSNKTANTIAIMSDCSPDHDYPLETMDREAVDALDRTEILSSKRVVFAQREGMMTVFTGFLDGIKVKVKNLSLKKNSCHYTITYSGVAKTFASEEPQFDQFLKSMVIE